MADRYTKIFGDQIDSTVGGLGLTKDTSDNFKLDVSSSFFEFATNTLTLKSSAIITDAMLVEDYIQTDEVDDITVEITSGGILQVKDGGIDTDQLADEAITEGKIDISNAPTDGYYLKWTTANGFTWADVDVDAIKDSDYIANEIPAGLINNSNTIFTLANTPVTGSVSVFLNGMLQLPGGGNDYTISGNTITFTKAPKNNSVLLALYIIA